MQGGLGFAVSRLQRFRVQGLGFELSRAQESCRMARPKVDLPQLLPGPRPQISSPQPEKAQNLEC